MIYNNLQILIEFLNPFLELLKTAITHPLIQRGQDGIVMQQRFLRIHAIFPAGKVKKRRTGDGTILAEFDFNAQVMNRQDR